MKKIIAFVILMASSSIAYADTPARIVNEYEQAFHQCYYGNPDRSEEDTQPFCDKTEALTKRLEKLGFCTYGKAGVGVPSKDKKHCYARQWK